MVHNNPLSYAASLQTRRASDINLVVIHCTELPDLSTARQYGEVIHHSESGTGNSGHFYIDRDGSVEQWVEPLSIAHHVIGHNDSSIGIELVNTGRYPDWLHSEHQQLQEPYPDKQIRALVSLINLLEEALPSITRIAGHEDLDTNEVPASDNPAVNVRRKLDPGPMFPWSTVLDNVNLRRN